MRSAQPEIVKQARPDPHASDLLPFGTMCLNLEQGETREPSEISRVAGQQSAAGKHRCSSNCAIWDLEPVLSPNEGGPARYESRRRLRRPLLKVPR